VIRYQHQAFVDVRRARTRMPISSSALRGLARHAVAAALAIAVTACSAGQQSPSAVRTSQPSATASPTATPAVLTGHIVFTRAFGNADAQAIFTAMADGSDEQRLTKPGEYCCLVRISPDGSRILTMPGEETTPVTGGALAIAGSGFTRLTLRDPKLNLVPQAWSPDGTRIAFEGWDDTDPSRAGIYTARAADGKDLIRVTTVVKLHDMPADYSPDGSRLVFYRPVTDDPESWDFGGSLWVVNVDGTQAHRIEMPGTVPSWWARWSPDGTKILFATARNQPTGELWTVHPDGSELTKILDNQGRFAIQPTWSPDGSQIMFALDPIANAFIHPQNGLYVIHADGSGLTLVIGGADFKSQPEWW
jgi:Tol biopolymer transport system component